MDHHTKQDQTTTTEQEINTQCNNSLTDNLPINQLAEQNLEAQPPSETRGGTQAREPSQLQETNQQMSDTWGHQLTPNNHQQFG